MLFSRGTKVQLQATGEEGVITALLDNGMLQVLLKYSEIEIPVFPEALIPLYDQSKSQAKIVKGKNNPPANSFNPPQVESQYTILKSKGIQLAFDPVYQGDDIPEKYIIYLLNDTAYDVIYQVSLKLGADPIFKEHGKLASVRKIQLGDIYYDELNESPTFEVDCCRVTTDGTGARHIKQLKLKPKQFFKKIQTAPIINRKVHLYQIFDNLKAERQDKAGEDLRIYTKQNVESAKTPQSPGQFWTSDIKSKAEFRIELDLHIESLAENHESLSNSEILQLQVKAFERYIDQALRLGVDRVFIIHGIGTGKLKNAIATKLIQMPFINTFKNEYHPKYGWGATEVIFD